MNARPCRWLAAALATLTTLPAALAPGGEAYTKRVQTALLSEPRSLAEPVAQLGYAQKLQVEARKGPWVQVSNGKLRGWIFAGNLAEEKPSETRGLDGLPVAASETGASTAARPLVPAAEEYSTRRGLGDAAEQLTWMKQQHAAVSAEEVQAFLREQRKGEHQ